MNKQNCGVISWMDLLNNPVEFHQESINHEIFDPTTGITYKDEDILELVCSCGRNKITTSLWFCFGLCDSCVRENFDTLDKEMGL